VVWLLLVAVALGVLAGFWLGALYGVLLVPVFIGLVVGVEEWRTRRRKGLGDRSVHFDENQHQFRNYTDALTRGVDVPTALSDSPSRDAAAPGANVDVGDRAP
jgi:hypothetical protein